MRYVVRGNIFRKIHVYGTVTRHRESQIFVTVLVPPGPGTGQCKKTL